MSPASSPIVAFLGGIGSFSEEASRRFLPACAPMPLNDFASIARAVCEGSADLGLLPVANSRVGSIASVRNLLAHPEVRIVGEETLAIRLHLLAKEGTTLEQVDEVASHPAALAQCGRYLDGRGWRRIAASSTAEAACQVASAINPTKACLASEAAASRYGLAILAVDIHDETDNRTTFAIIERRDQFA